MKPTKSAIVAAAVAALLSQAASAPAADKLDLNKATVEQLMKLPEMNEARAKAIINYRGSQGEFIQVEELTTIPQVKPILPKIRDHLTVE